MMDDQNREQESELASVLEQIFQQYRADREEARELLKAWHEQVLSPEAFAIVQEEIRLLNDELAELRQFQNFLEDARRQRDLEQERLGKAEAIAESFRRQMSDTIESEVPDLPVQEEGAQASPADLFSLMQRIVDFSDAEIENLVEIIGVSAKMTDYQRAFYRQALQDVRRMTPEQREQQFNLIKDLPIEQIKNIAETRHQAVGMFDSWTPAFTAGGQQASASFAQEEQARQDLAACTQKIEQLSREQQPVEWAQAVYQRVSLYLLLAKEGQDDYLLLAIEDITAILSIFTRESAPVLWASVIQTRGAVFMRLTKGERRENLAKALADFDQASEVFASLQMEQPLSAVKAARAMVLVELGGDGQGEQMEEMLQQFMRGQENGMFSSLPAMDASTAVMRGMALMQRRDGDRAQNIEQAIAELSEAVELLGKDKLWIQRAVVMGARAGAYFDRILGERIENLRNVLTDSDEALSVLSYEHTPEPWAMACSTRAMAGMRLYELTHELTQERAIADCENALRVFSRERNQEMWETLIHLRCSAYITRDTGDARQNATQALTDANQLVRHFSREKTPQQWVEALVLRCNVYTFRADGGRRKNLELALADCDAALTVVTREASPEQWAKVVSNRNRIVQELGIAVTRQTKEQIYADYDAALALLSSEKNPLEWGTLQVNYGNSYLTQGTSNPQQYLKNLASAQEHYEQALRVFSYEQQPLLWAQTHVNLGMVKRQLLPKNLAEIMSEEAGYSELLHEGLQEGLQNVFAEIAQLRQNVPEAISHFDRALTVLSYEATPREWAIAHKERGLAYYLLSIQLSFAVSERKQYFLRAQEDFADALKVITRESGPLDWAILQYNCGLMYRGMLVEDPKTDALHALAHCAAALEVYSPEVMPATYRRVQMLRALMLERLERWSDAHEALLKAREVQRDLVAASISEQGSLEAIADNAFVDIYVRDARVLLHLEPQNLREAVVALEEGRAQNMRMVLDLDSIDPEKIVNTVARERMKEFLHARNQWRKQQHALADLLPASNSVATDQQQRQQHYQFLQQAYEAFIAARETIRKHDDPDFMTPVPTMQRIASSVSEPGEALIYLAMGTHSFVNPPKFDGVEEEGVAFIVLRTHDGQERIRHLALPRLTSNAVSALVVRDAKSNIAIQVERALRYLGEFGLNTLAAVLQEEGVHKVIFVAYGRLGLFPLAAVPVRVAERTVCLGELFEVSFAPGARAAEIAQARTVEARRSRTRQSLLLAGNPFPTPQSYKDLPYTELEVQNIQEIAKEHGYLPSRLKLLLREQVNKQNLLKELPNARYVHLAMHGSYVADDPRASCLILAGDERTGVEQRTITLGEALDGRISLAGIQLLVLSACETSLIDVRNIPNEVIGLAAGFLQAGVAGVIASLWSVDDRASAALMIRFAELYLNPQNTWSPARALAEAQRWLREEATNRVLAGGDGEDGTRTSYAFRSPRSSDEEPRSEDPDALPFADPRYWAAFVVTGG
ncbi:MAG TPA: CHAT domain-containing protein [Ktedonobacteraceae bacterium]|nr:CHAT domain-containing protein [Ktedonobacteraceae bacterium]